VTSTTTPEPARPRRSRPALSSAPGSASSRPLATLPLFRVGPEQGLAIGTHDERFTVRLDLLATARYSLGFTGSRLTLTSFEVPALLPVLSGNLVRPWVHYLVQLSLSGPSVTLLDLAIEAQPVEAFGVRIGQFVTPFARAFMTAPALLQFFDRSIATTFFEAGRGTGVMVFGVPFDGRFEYSAGVFNSNGINQNGNNNLHMLWVGRVVFSPFGATPYTETPALGDNPFRLALGLNAYVNKPTLTEQVVDPTTGMLVTRSLGEVFEVVAGVDLAARAGPWMLQAEGYFRRRAGQNAWGGYAQSGLFVLPRHLELAQRVALLNPDTTVPNNLIVTSETQLAYYFLGNHLEILLAYTLLHAERTTTLVPAGFSHTLTTQVQLWY
jgi:hypothetical protein